MEWLKKGEPLDVKYLDFQKVFIKMPFQSSMRRLHGVRGNILEWGLAINNY